MTFSQTYTRTATKKPIIIVQGAQYGSEAKGMVAHALCTLRAVKWAVRTGSINAGHTIWSGGEKKVYQQLPVAADLKINCVIGPGAYVHVPTLDSEMQRSGLGYDNLLVDYNCGVHLDEYQEEARQAGRSMKIGATGKGCAEAILHKIKDRGVGDKPLLLREHLMGGQYESGVLFADTARMLNDAYDRGDQILIEGTQGTLLDLHTGPYPFVTSRQTTAAAWVTEAGLSPALDYEVILVARTFPIRVAGNSGPMPFEIDWPSLMRSMNIRLKDAGYGPIAPESALLAYEKALADLTREMGEDGKDKARLEAPTQALMSLPVGYRLQLIGLFETTTVTKRLRRIAMLDVAGLAETVRKERPSSVVLTFLNYVFPELVHTRKLHDAAIRYIRGLERSIDCPIAYTSIGPEPGDLMWCGDD
jgi:adenylosuccinate synthase